MGKGMLDSCLTKLLDDALPQLTLHRELIRELADLHAQREIQGRLPEAGMNDTEGAGFASKPSRPSRMASWAASSKTFSTWRGSVPYATLTGTE